MKVNIEVDEWYPVFYIYKEGGRWFRKNRKTYDIPSQKVVELDEIFRKFNEAQDYLRGKMDDNSKKI